MNVNKKAVICSGYFDPIHVGHVLYFLDSASHGDLFVIVNSDAQARLKKSKPFMHEAERLIIVRAMQHVLDAELSTSTDKSVITDIERVYKDLLPYGYNKFYFAKGGDSTKDNVPEQAICDELGIEILWDVGGAKVQSSSWLTGLKPRYHV